VSGFDSRMLEAFDTALWPVAVAVALLVLGVGAVVLRRQWRAFQHRRAQGHGHESVAHGHGSARGELQARSGERGRGPGGLDRGPVMLDLEAPGRERGRGPGGLGREPASRGREGHARGRGHGPGGHHHHGPAEGVAPWSWAGLFGIASAGALIPSPAAFLLLVSGLVTGRAALAVVMVACFGVGLATTVLAVGLMVIAGRDWLGRKVKDHGALAGLGAWAPLAGAAAIVCGGFVLSAGALAALVP
jgi:nickel/cobalt exporter